MPQAILKWKETHNFIEVDKVKQRILFHYRSDIAKHTGGLRQRVEGIFDAIPGQLSKHEKKFKLSAVNKQARFREYEDGFSWLVDAMMVNLCFNSIEPNVGLRMNEKRSLLKCYMGDTGLLLSMAFADGSKMSGEIYKKLLVDKLEVNKGMLVENAVAQMLTASGHNLFFYSNASPTDVSKRMGIDFLIQKKKITSRHNISPIEVKSSTRYTTVSLDRFRDTYAQMLDTSYIVHTGDLECTNDLIYLPIYMVPLL